MPAQRVPFKSSSERKQPAVLVTCACAALVLANSGWADAYHRLLATTIAIATGGHELSLTIHQWINDALMSVFFLIVD